MARIYISSTYSDLVEAREAVYGALRKMRHEVVAMEDYVAADQRPLDKCLADVAACDIYVGIFAWRYGYVPPDQERSITELEFRQAQQSRKPCLLFLLHEEAPWPRKLLDRNLEPIEGLRAELARDYIVNFFRTPDDLAAAVSVSVVGIEKASSQDGNGRPLNETQLLELVSKLVNQCDELLRERKESDHKAYDDFVEGALADFETVHQNYLESFQSYRKMVDGQSVSLNAGHPVLKKLDEDMLFTTQLRLKLEALKEFQQDPLFGSFIKKIVEYTQGTEFSKRVLLTGRRGLNVRRGYTIAGLTEIFGKEISDSQKQKEALALLDRVVSELQVAYGHVLDEHMKLKKRLLDSRRQ
jgi:hypothetical protein